MTSENNVLYLVAGSLATLTLLASGVFAVAPYIGFLAPLVVLSVELPFIIGCAVFSVVVIALSYKAISKNKAISEKDAQIPEKEKEVSEKDAKPVGQAKEIEELERGGAFVPQEAKDIQIASKEEFIGVRVARIIEDGLKGVYGAMPSTGSVKGTLSGIGDKLKNGSVGYMKRVGAFVLQVIKDIQTASKEAFISVRATRIVKDGLKGVYGAMPSTGSVKGTLSGIGDKLKNGSVGYIMRMLELAKKKLGSIGGSEKEEKNAATENLSGLKATAPPYVAANTTTQKDPNQPTKEENGQACFTLKTE